MRISTKDWNNYIRMLSQLNNKAGELMRDYVARNGFGNTEAIIDYAYGLVTKYGEGSAALAAEMYDATAALSDVTVPPAEVAETASHNEVAKAINGTIKHSINPNSCGNTVSRLVKRAGADTTLKNAKRDGAQFAWVPMGDTCPFCLTLASRGFQYISSKSLKNGHAEHIHANCDCAYTVRFDNTSGVKGYNPQVYKDMYDNAEGRTSKEKINSMRRRYYEENKDKINAQKRAAYAFDNSDVMYRKINRIKAEDGHEIIDDRTYKKLTKDFIADGGIIIRGKEAEDHLAGKGYAAYLPGFNTAVIRDDATTSDVLEEMYHAQQDKNNMYGKSTADRETFLLREIDAQKHLLKMKKRYKIPSEETELTKMNLEDYENQLERLLDERKRQ